MPSMHRITVRGRVQGVGFRPYVFNLATKLGCKGFVLNTGDGVDIVIDRIDPFVSQLRLNSPPLSRIDSIEISQERFDILFDCFSIIASEPGHGFGEIPADLFLCKDCLRELDSISDPRSGYFFITCTNCGPRYSIAQGTPYDRPNTSMADFPMCGFCSSQYADPKDRRYHAQTVACPVCGPQLSLFAGKSRLDSDDPILEAAELIKSGQIVSIKGIGGFHFCCLTDDTIVAKLRILTNRPSKPFAIMVKDLDMLRSLADFGPAEADMLQSSARPIVLLRKRKPFQAISEHDTIGIMLPYTGLHYLLFRHIDTPLVMTSANMPNHPISGTLEEQSIHYVLDTNRRIINRIDDSVIKPVSGRFLFLRRSRGYVPNPVDLKSPCPDLIALGGDMNNTVCVVKAGKAYLSQYLGNLDNLDAFNNYKASVMRFISFLDAQPKYVLHDLHPGYNSTAFAAYLSSLLKAKTVPVQHHEAHVCAVAAESGLDSFVGIAADGLGYGSDGKVLGSEVFDASVLGISKIGSLEEYILPGGDASAMYPERALFSILRKWLSLEEIAPLVSLSLTELETLEKQLRIGFNCVPTTSAGRLLDAASAMLGFCRERQYDGRPAMLLESHSSVPYDLEPNILMDSGFSTLTIKPLFMHLYEHRGSDPGRLAATVQQYLAKGLYSIAQMPGKPIVFGGGCAYNRIMASFMTKNGVLINEKVPCGDGGLSFGQAARFSLGSFLGL